MSETQLQTGTDSMRPRFAKTCEECIIQAEGLEVSFGGAPVLTDVSFSVRPGQIFAILGGSGSGKTTLLRVLLGLLPATRGLLRLAGTHLVGATEEAKALVVRNLGVAFQT